MVNMESQTDTEPAHKLLSDKLKSLYDHLKSELKALIPATDPAGPFVNRLLASLRPSFMWGLYTGETPPLGPSPPGELENLIAELTTAVLGFAFGLTPDGRPGRSNEDMAEVIGDLLRVKEGWNRVYVQWEIADALQDKYNIAQIPPDNVAWPPQFTPAEIKDPDQLAAKLYYSRDPLVPCVYNSLPQDTQKTIADWANSPGSDEGLRRLAEVLACGLNELLRDPRFHQGIPRWLRLPQLERDLATEVRQFPPEGTVLGQGQAIRVNRFILESVFPDELAPGKYLSTRGVIEKVMDNIKAAGFKNVILVANPGHMFRCYELVEEAALDRGMNLGIYVADCTKVCYDPDSAQSWTQTLPAFWEYDIISRARELALKQILDEKRKVKVLNIH
jgi:hypothetical protein